MNKLNKNIWLTFSKLKALLKLQEKKIRVLQKIRPITLGLVLITVFYLLLIQPDRYISLAKIVINQGHIQEASAMSLSGGQGVNSIDSAIVAEHIKSIEMLQFLDNEVDLRKIYSRRASVRFSEFSFSTILKLFQNIDIFSRLSSSAGIDDLHRYFLGRTKVSHDAANGIITIEVQSFRAEDSRKILAKIINSSEQFINRLSKEVAIEQLEFIRVEVSNAEEKIIDIQKSMQKIQQRFNVADPTTEVNNTIQMIGELEKQKNTKEVELASRVEFEGETAKPIKKLKHELRVLNKQIQELKEKIIVDSSVTSDNDMLFQQKNLERKLEFASSSYRSALSAQEKIRSESVQNLKKLVVITGPTVEQEASYPKRMYNITLFLCLFGMAYYVFRATYASIMSHKSIG
ncbi:MAG TPA: hypothetical protein DIV86_05860 [Alphaproteobacteria bacterium]|nr:hypothetical protein [Alphaproteobacteria bacterium]